MAEPFFLRPSRMAPALAVALMWATPAIVAMQTAPAAAQNVEDLARQLAAPSASAVKADARADDGCAQKLPDGSCPDMPGTRQWVKTGATASAGLGRAARAQPARAASTQAVRQDIAMTFLVGSAQLTDSAKATLDRFAQALSRIGSYRPFTVEGHTDRSGSRETNQALSQARAQSVVDYLSSKGVDRTRLAARGYGFDKPLQGRDAGDPANRRVEVAAR